VTAIEANVDGLIGATHSYVGLSPGNLASQTHAGQVSNPRAAVIQGLAKMRSLADLGVPQFVLPPQARPDLQLLRRIGFAGSDEQVIDAAWAEVPNIAAAAFSASPMWAANCATVTPSADSIDGRLHFTPANLISHLHRSLEAQASQKALTRLFPNPELFAIHDPLPAQASFSDEGAANHVRLCDHQGEQGVNLFVHGRSGQDDWPHAFPARQTREAFEAIERRHGARGAVHVRQSERAILAGAFHNDVVCVGTDRCLFFHELAFSDTPSMRSEVQRAAEGRFEAQFVEISETDLPIAEAIRSYLFNSQLVQIPGTDRLTLISPLETRDSPQASAVVENLINSNGPIAAVQFVDVRESMRNGGGPACLRLRVVMTQSELSAANDAQRLTPQLHGQLQTWAERNYRDQLAPRDLADPHLAREVQTGLDELSQMLGLGSDFYPFQQA
jgi:succinylarginine dihydrolase